MFDERRKRRRHRPSSSGRLNRRLPRRPSQHPSRGQGRRRSHIRGCAVIAGSAWVHCAYTAGRALPLRASRRPRSAGPGAATGTRGICGTGCPSWSRIGRPSGSSVYKSPSTARSYANSSARPRLRRFTHPSVPRPHVAVVSALSSMTDTGYQSARRRANVGGSRRRASTHCGARPPSRPCHERSSDRDDTHRCRSPRPAGLSRRIRLRGSRCPRSSAGRARS